MRTLPYIAFVLLLSAKTQVTAQQPQEKQPPTQPSQPAQPTGNQGEASEVLLSKTVVLITTYLQGTGAAHGGTGFLVSVADSRLPTPQAFSYLVTNRHVAEAIFKDGDNDCQKHPISNTFVTMNLKNEVNGNRSVRFLLSPPVNSWYFPDDPGVDLAVAPFGVSDELDAVGIGDGVFLTPDVWKQFGVTPGDKVLTTGFFRLYTGVHQFQPMVREGVLSMIPDDRMKATLCQPARVYLTDLHVIPGNSGSPVFLGPKSFLGGLVHPSNGGIPYLFLGVVAGYMYEDSDLTLRTTTDYEAVLHANSGIAIVVPAEQLKTLLTSAPLRQLRDQTIASMNTPKPK
jgi:phage tail protein X